MNAAIDSAGKTYGLLDTLLGARPEERVALGWSFLYFFTLLSGYYILRPVREEMIVANGVDRIQWIFTAVFFIMLALVPIYGAIVSRFPRRRFLPIVFGTVIVALLGFHLVFLRPEALIWSAPAFAIFLSVFNLFAVSVFWSFMSDIFTAEQSRRLFGLIAAGGTVGALCGPLVTALLAVEFGVPNLLLVSAALFTVCLVCIFRLVPWARAQEARLQRADGEALIGGSIFAGAERVFRSRLLFAIVLLMFFGVSVGTLLYNQQAAVTKARLADPGERTQFFATVDFAVNLVAILIQLGLTRALLTRFGVGPLLLIPPLLITAGLIAIGLRPDWMLLAIVQVLTRAGNFSLVQPARESLFTRVDRESRYKAKNFIDTFIYRGGDAVTSWAYVVLFNVGASLSTMAFIWAGVAAIYGAASWWVVRLERDLPTEAAR